MAITDYFAGDSFKDSGTVDQRAARPASQYMTPETSVAHQTERFMSEDSPLMRQAMAQARRGQVAGGMLDTDATATNVRNQMFQEALQLGEKEAETATRFGLGKQLAESSLGSIYAQGDIATGQIQQKHQNTMDQLEREYGFKWDFQEEQNKFQREILDAGFDQQNAQLFGQLLTSLVDNQLAAAGRIMATPDATYTQDMQTTSENMINAFKPWLAGLLGIDLVK